VKCTDDKNDKESDTDIKDNYMHGDNFDSNDNIIC